MRKKIVILTVFYALLIGILCRQILSPENADWLTLETPSSAMQNHQFNIRVTLLKPEEGMYLSADLHWMTDEKESHGFLSGIKPVKIVKDKAVYELSIPMRKENPAGFIFPVVFLSTDGTWNMHTKAAEAEPVPVLKSNEVTFVSALKIKRTHDIAKTPESAHPESASLRFIAAGLWLVAALIAISAGRKLNTKIIAAAALLSALWEAFNTSALSGNALRYLAWFIKGYNERREPQQITTILILICFALISLYMIYSLYKKGRIIIWSSLLIYWTVSLLQILSLHEVDSFFSITIAHMQMGQMIRLAVSFVCLSAIIARIFFNGEIRKISSE